MEAESRRGNFISDRDSIMCCLLHKPWHFSRLVGDIQIPVGRHHGINLCVSAVENQKHHVLIQKNEMRSDGAQQEGL